MMTVHEVSKLAGVSIRTLQYYDTIGLLHPAGYTDSGYRLYDDTDLKRLQQILLFRELEFPLKEIRRIMENPDFDQAKALSQQIDLLTLRRKHLDDLLKLARQLQRKGENNMDFKAFDTSKIDEYTQKAKASWGDTAEYKEYEAKHGKRSSADSKKAAETTVLKNLERCDFIISFQQYGNKSRGTLYRLVDFYTLFYYKFINAIDSKDEQWWTHNYNSHSVESWQGYAFELICLTHIAQIRKRLGIAGISTSASSWRYLPSKSEEGKKAQIDLVIERGDRNINLCEMKFCVGPFTIKNSYAEDVRRRIQLFKEKEKTTYGLISTFVTTYGVADGIHKDVADAEVTAEDLFG